MLSYTCSLLFCFACLAVFVLLTQPTYSRLDYLYYDESCPNLTAIVNQGVSKALSKDVTNAPSLLITLYHDCIANGCDASILLDDTSTMKGEKNTPQNSVIKAYDIIDDIKANVEKACPATVSCADILPLAARHAVIFVGGPSWPVALGRRDALIARAVDANQIPMPNEPLDTIAARFIAKGFTLRDMVALSGAHTIGSAPCIVLKTRLYNFNGTGKPDPHIDPTLLAHMKHTCPNQNNSDFNTEVLDRTTPKTFDNNYYVNVAAGKGVLSSDQRMMDNMTTASMVLNYARYPENFIKDFTEGMVKMTNLGSLTGSDGEIRKNCRVVNHSN